MISRLQTRTPSPKPSKSIKHTQYLASPDRGEVGSRRPFSNHLQSSRQERHRGITCNIVLLCNPDIIVLARSIKTRPPPPNSRGTGHPCCLNLKLLQQTATMVPQRRCKPCDLGLTTFERAGRGRTQINSLGRVSVRLRRFGFMMTRLPATIYPVSHLARQRRNLEGDIHDVKDALF